LERRSFVFKHIPARTLAISSSIKRKSSWRSASPGGSQSKPIDLLLPERVAGTEGAHKFLREGLELFGVFAQREHGLALVVVADVCAVLQGIELGVLLGGGVARSGGMLCILARGGEQLGRKLG
jgi:hypothetical protein